MGHLRDQWGNRADHQVWLGLEIPYQKSLDCKGDSFTKKYPIFPSAPALASKGV
jgi:hypothetical protein